jgi:peptidase M28-like protein
MVRRIEGVKHLRILVRPSYGVLLAVVAVGGALARAGDSAIPQVCSACIRKNLSYLAGPTLHGRGSGTVDERRAAQFIAAKLKSYGLAPAASDRNYIQAATIKSRNTTASVMLSFEGAKGTPWVEGKELAVFRVTRADVTAALQKLDLNDPQVTPASVKPGSAVLLKLKPDTTPQNIEAVIGGYITTKAAVILLPEPSGGEALFQQLAQHGHHTNRQIGEEPASPDGLILSSDAAQQLWKQEDGTQIKLHVAMSPWKISHTWNVLARLEGSKESKQIIMLSAHLDHLGIKDGKTYPGADDDASGTVAVIELAHALAKQERPQRTIVFALWGSEEAGLVGARYFLKHPTFELHDLIANLEFEMIGRADPKVKPNELWLTGWERSNLGPELAAHGAQLVADPHPDQNFFQRSDNFALARDGIVAQTVSSYGLHKDYHQPTDTLTRIDWQHLDSAIGSMIVPIMWLANSDFTPEWNDGGKPQ